MEKDNTLKNKVSNFQTKVSKRLFESTANYQNSMRPNRMDPRIFSVYKILDPRFTLQNNNLPIIVTTYVESNYWDNYYTEEQPL